MNEVDVYHPTTEVEHKDGREFSYVLNTKRTKAKLLKGAKRANNLEIERKTGCVNFLFSDGSYHEVVLPMLRVWHKKLEEGITVNDFEIKVIESDQGIDGSENHVDTKLVIIVNSNRIVLHAYNSKQKLMVQGQGYEDFSFNCLEPLFKQKIENSLDKICNINNDVKTSLGAEKAVKNFKCPQCEVKTIKNSDLKVHMKTCHTKPGINSPPRNKVPKILNEDISLLDESVMKGIDMDEIPEEDKVCEWLTCDFHANEMSILRKHFEDVHMVYLRGKYLTPQAQNIPEIENGIWCYICGFEAEEQEQFDRHMKSMHPSSSNDIAEPSHLTKEDIKVNILLEEVSDDTDSKVELKPVSKDAGGPAHDVTIFCEVCGQEFLNENELNVHMSTHINHAGDNMPTFSCEVCDINFSDPGNLNQHKQAYHMSVQVNIATEDTNCIVCDLCKYSCKYNIQLRKHMKTVHGIEQKYNCKGCNYKTDYVANTWVHMLRKHPDQSVEFEREQSDSDIILKLVADQNAEIINKINDLGGAFEKLVDIVNTVKTESDDKCQILADGIMKINTKLSKFKVKRETPKPDDKVKDSNPVEEKKMPTPKSYAAVTASSLPPPVKISAPPPKTTLTTTRDSLPMTRPKQNYNYLSKPKLLYVGDSLGHSASLRKIEEFQNCRIQSARAYSSVYDKDARWPEQNFSDVVKHALQKSERDCPDILLMSAPTVDISNLNTQNLSPSQHTETFKEKAIKSSQNMFAIAERALETSPNLSKVIIMEHPPRFDTPYMDPTSLKPNLARLANATLGGMWINSPLKDRIVIGQHSLESSGSGAAHFERYQGRGGKYDGVHLYGKTGSRDYTNSVMTILSMAVPRYPGPEYGTARPDVDDHSSCPQAQYQRRMKNSQYLVETRNRFDLLNQGNW